MAEFFRFRSMKHLLAEFQELEKQTIYFASPEKLNDPMEGFRDIVWSGDKIVWTNLFKNYVYCLNWAYFQLKTVGDSIQLGSLPILGRWDELPVTEKDLFNNIWYRFLDVLNIQEIIEVLSNTKRKIRYEEFEYYLQAIHPVLLTEIVRSYDTYQLSSESEMFQSPPASLKQILTLMKQDAVETEEQLNTILLERKRVDNSERIIQQYNSRTIFTEASEKNNQLVIYDCPRVYLKELENLLWPKWYTACFTKSYHNSSVWGNYGDNHKGACLIFESIEKDQQNCLELNQLTSEKSRTIRFSEVSYEDKAGEIDFFRSIGRRPEPALLKLWYTDQTGNISEYADRIQPDWDNFYRDITIKTKDWKYEQEHRLIIHNESELDDKDRKLTYNFNSLKGIIFGIKTSDKDKLKVIKIIEGKCRENNRTDFKLFQAYYSPEHGDIRKYEIELPFFDNDTAS